jgi:hypothetical protein
MAAVRYFNPFKPLSLLHACSVDFDSDSVRFCLSLVGATSEEYVSHCELYMYLNSGIGLEDE